MIVFVKIKDGKLITPWYCRPVAICKIHLIGLPFRICDRLPWFARKRLLNWLLGEQCFTDFTQTDRLLKSDELIKDPIIKW
jgi:hypothetical protein